ncbi:MAG: hypothetical protein ACRDSP_07135 [Pseudonocardiaceae bacterium]
MKYRGPVITLLAVAALAAALLVVNMRTAAQTQTAAVVVASPANAQPPAAAQSAPAPRQPAGAPASPPADVRPGTYAGRTSGNEATIAIKVRDDKASAYLCAGKRTEAWLKGTVSGGRVTLQGTDGAMATGLVQGDAVFGTVQLQGTQRPYAAQLATSPS